MELHIRIKGAFKIVTVTVLFATMCVLACAAVYRLVKSRTAKTSHKKQIEAATRFRYNFHVTDSIKKGYLLLTPYNTEKGGSGLLTIVDMSGKTVKSVVTKNEALCFRQWKLDGKTRYTYFEAVVADTAGFSRIGSDYELVVLDSMLTELKRIRLQSFLNFPPSEKLRIDGHDVIMLGEDHFIVYAGYPEKSENVPGYLLAAPNTKIITPVIEEVKNGSIVWQWDAGRFPEFYANSLCGNNYSDPGKTLDPIHMNAMSLDPYDSNLVLSLCNLNQVVKISRKTGEVLWRLGGRNSDFDLPKDLIFSGQHHATICAPGPILLMLDDSPTPWRKRSRVLELVLDEKHKKITSVKATPIIERNAQKRGSVQVVGDDYIVGGGVGKFVTVLGRADHRKKMVMYMNHASYRTYYVETVPGLR